MGKQVDLACATCSEEFLVPVGVYRSKSGVLICPCCGSTDLVLLGVREAAGGRAEGAAA
jgi:DNA-directed RNA polymerase subunit RPC12/RpoP